MTVKLTVGIYIKGKPVDVFGYTERSVKDVFFQAAALLAVFAGCETKEQYRERKYGADAKMRQLPETDVIYDLIYNISDYHLIADLDTMSIYKRSHLFRTFGFQSLHEPGNSYSAAMFILSGLCRGCSKEYLEKQYARTCEIKDHRYLEHLDTIADYFRSTLSLKQCETIRGLFLDDARLFYTLPKTVRDALVRTGRTHENCANQCYDA